MDARDIGERISRGLAWVGAASSVVGALDTLANFLVLALWISPGEQGIAAAALWLFPILDIVIDGGLSAAIIRRDEVSHSRLSTIFWLNVGLSVVTAAALVPVGSALTGHPAAAMLLAAYGLKLLLQNVFFVPQAMMRRELRFKELSVIRVLANVAGVTAKIASAAAGAGAWCYIAANFAHAIVTATGIQLAQPFRPRLVLRLREAADDIRFGVATALREILFNFYTNVDYRVVIAFFGKEANGLYYFAYTTLLQPVRYVSQVVVEVAFPAFARLRHDRARAGDQLVTFTRLNLVVVLPFVAWIAVAGEDVVRVLFGSEWAPAVTAMRLLCVVGALRAVAFVLPPLLEGLGHPRRSLAYAAFASVTMPVAYVVAAWTLGGRLGWLAVVVAWLMAYPLVFAVLLWIALKTLGLTARVYARRVVGIVLCVGAAAWLAVAARVAATAGGLGAPLRLVATTATLLAAAALLLARFEGIHLKSLATLLRTPGAAGR